jgi:hypothetical protein
MYRVVGLRRFEGATIYRNVDNRLLTDAASYTIKTESSIHRADKWYV